jgi:predicted ATPase
LLKQVWRVRDSWETAWTNVRNNLKGCQRVFQKWVRNEVGNLEEKIRGKEQELQFLQMLEPDCDLEEYQVKDEIHSLLDKKRLNGSKE